MLRGGLAETRRRLVHLLFEPLRTRAELGDGRGDAFAGLARGFDLLAHLRQTHLALGDQGGLRFGALLA